jgi:hypothetical protein
LAQRWDAGRQGGDGTAEAVGGRKEGGRQGQRCLLQAGQGLAGAPRRLTLHHHGGAASHVRGCIGRVGGGWLTVSNRRGSTVKWHGCYEH